MNKNELFERYFIEGTAEELENPLIQSLLIKNGFADIVVDSVLFIKDEQVIKDIYSSELMEDDNFKLMQGKIVSMNFEKIEKKEFDFCFGKFVFIENKTNKEYILDRGFVIKEDTIEAFKKEIEPYKDDIIVILETLDEKKEISCFIKNINN